MIRHVQARHGSRGASANNVGKVAPLPQKVIRSDLGRESVRWRAALKSGEA